MQNFVFKKNFYKTFFSILFLFFFKLLLAETGAQKKVNDLFDIIGSRDDRRSNSMKKAVKLMELYFKISPRETKEINELRKRVEHLISDDSKRKSYIAAVKAEIEKNLQELKEKNESMKNAANKNELEKEIEILKEKNDSLEEYEQALEKSAEDEQVKNLIIRYQKAIEVKERLKDYFEAEVSGGGWGDLILRGIAGKNWEKVEDQKKVGNNILEGFGKGLMLRAADSTGNAIGSIVDRYIQTFFNSTLGKFESFLGFVYRGIFHSACRPFTIEELGYWRKLVGDDFREIEMMIKNAEKLDSRSKADILREYDNEQEPEAQVLNLWQDFVEDLAFTYEELAQEIELRKGYYKKEKQGFGVVNCADRLINKLLKIRRWLLSVKSLRDFANIPEAKSIIPAMKRSIDNYFVNLSNQVKPLGVNKTTKFDFGDNNYSKKDHWGNDFNEGSSYPGYMTE